MTATPIDLLSASLLEVFDERDASLRRVAMARTFAEDVSFHEAEGTVTGYEALDARIVALQADAPPDWVFQAAGSSAIDDLGRAAWTFGPPAGPGVVRGTDIGIVRDGRIASLYTFIDVAP